MSPVKATHKEISDFIGSFSSWSLENEKLHKEFVFVDFVQAFGFMTEVALIAEQMNHHPEWLNVYRIVVVELTTHEAYGITERDFNMAKKMDEVANRRLVSRVD